MIPTKIKVGTHWYAVNAVDKITKPNSRGRIYFGTKLIILAQNSAINEKAFRPEQKRQTFWHEMTHAILHDMEHPLYKNETFVEAFSLRLSKAIDSAKFK